MNNTNLDFSDRDDDCNLFRNVDPVVACDVFAPPCRELLRGFQQLLEFDFGCRQVDILFPPVERDAYTSAHGRPL